MHRPLIIINPAAAKTRRAWPNIQSSLKDAAIEYDLRETSEPGDATQITRAALRAGCTTVAVVGGDGTLSEAAEGFFEFVDTHSSPRSINPNTFLAILPAGTGDDFARGLVGKRVSLARWIERFIAHCRAQDTASTRLVDVLAGSCDGYTKPFICLNASTMGIGGETASRVAAQRTLMRRLSGEARFMAAAVGALAAWRERRVRVLIDDEEMLDAEMNLVAVANGLYAGGGMMLSPAATVDDGKLDVVTASGLKRLHVMRELPRIHSGGHVENPKVKIQQGTKVRIETFAAEDALLIEADGNVRGRTPVEFRVLPAALKFVV